MVGRIAQNVELHIEKLFELQPQACPLHLFSIMGIVNEAHGFIARAEVQRFRDIRGQRLRYWRWNLIEQRLHDSLHATTLQPTVLHLLGGHVIRLHTHFREHQLIGLVDVGMRELEATAIDGGTSENDVFDTHLITVVDVFRGIEPNQIHHAMSVGKMGYDALLACAHSKLLECQDMSFDLHKRHIAPQLVDGVDTTSVDVFVGIVFQQVAPRVDIDFFVEDVLSSRTHTGQELDVLVENTHCFNNASATSKSKGVVILMFSRLPSTICT